MEEHIIISWHYTTHGIAYFKHILAAFYAGKVKVDQEKISEQGISQKEMNDVFDQNILEKYPNGFLFDKAYLLHSREEVIQKVTDRRYKYRRNMLNDVEVQDTNMVAVWKDVIENWQAVLKHAGKEIMPIHCDTEGEKAERARQDSISMQDEIAYVEHKYPEKAELFKKQLWRDMQHYTIKDQIKWFNEISNGKNKYKTSRFKEVQLPAINNMRDEKEIIGALNKWFSNITQQHSPNAHYFINTSLGTSEVQVAWYLLAQNGRLPHNTRFIKTHDDKSDTENPRFKCFSIKEYSTQILKNISTSLNLYEGDLSEKRQLVRQKLETYYRLGFAILIMGERGTGKSNLVKVLGIENIENKDSIVDINCASIDSDSKAESIFFGYKKGAFTGAEKDTEGLFHKANRGILFFDEVHHLSKMVQSKLIKALQTDQYNSYTYRQLGGDKELKTEFRAIFATNLSVSELKEKLLPDFFDRIAQTIITLPPLRETPEDRLKDWEKVWKELRFEEAHKMPVPSTPPLGEWLKGLSLPGNFRDLQKIAISYFSYKKLPHAVQKMEQCENALEYAKKQYKIYHYDTIEGQVGQEYLSDLFDATLLQEEKDAYKFLLKNYKMALLDWVEKAYPDRKPHELLGISHSTYYELKKNKM